MAKTLTERLIAAKSPRARLADNEALLGDLQKELDRLNAARDRAAGESIDFALTDADREAAAANAGRYERTAKGLEVEIAALTVLIEERRDSEAAQRIEAERAAVREERDALAAEFAKVVPQAVDQLTSLFARVKANAARLQAIGDHNGCAEKQARNVSGMLGMGGVMQFTKMIIPSFEGVGRAWPPADRQPVLFDVGQAMRNAQRDREAYAKAQLEQAEKFAREHGKYRLSTVFADYATVDIPSELRAKAPVLPHKVSNATAEIEYTLPHAVAEELRQVAHLRVAALETKKPTR